MNQQQLAFLGEGSSGIYQASAPGRMDIMGGIADYSGSLVLQMPLRESTTVHIALRNDNIFKLRSEADGEVLEFSIEKKEFVNETADYVYARQALAEKQGGSWASYILGSFLVLYREAGIPLMGANVYVTSQVPAGKGVSSSAALEVAVMRALVKIHNIKTKLATALPIWAQKAENEVVGSPCGLMDQLASHLGEHGKLLPITCQPDIIHAPMPMPTYLKVVGIDSGIRHAVSGASYSDVRAAAFMGYSIIALNSGATVADLVYARNTGDKKRLPFGGYLANIAPSQFEFKLAELLPEALTGRDFLNIYKVSIDRQTEINPDTVYHILNCTRHPVNEQYRVSTFFLHLNHLNKVQEPPMKRKQYLHALGELMYKSHASYSSCGLGNTQTDEIVDMVSQSGIESSIYGAKITGGGSGGVVCVLCEGEEGLKTARNIYLEYAGRIKKNIVFFG